jgi:hypothetical protein
MENESKRRARTDAHFEFGDLENRVIVFFWIFQFEVCLGIGIWDLELRGRTYCPRRASAIRRLAPLAGRGLR